MLDLIKLKTFRAVAEANSFTRAAAELGYSQSSVTMHIRALEEELGASLFDRVKKGVILTEAGRRTFDYAGRLLALAEETKAAAHVQAEPAGALTVSAPEWLLVSRLPGVLHQFQSLYPQVHLSLSVQADCQTQIRAVLDGELDIAFLVDEPIRQDDLTARSLGREEILLVASHDRNLAAWEELGPDALAGIQILLPDKNSVFRQLLDRALSALPFPMGNKLELGSLEAIKQCAVAGMGLAVLPRSAVSVELRQKRLLQLPWGGPGFPIHVQMLRRREGRTSPAVHAMWRLAEQSFEAEHSEAM